MFSLLFGDRMLKTRFAALFTYFYPIEQSRLEIYSETRRVFYLPTYIYFIIFNFYCSG